MQRLSTLCRVPIALWLAYLLVTNLLFYTHILTPLLLPVQAAVILLLETRAALAPKSLVAAGLLILPYLPLLFWQWPLLAEPAETGSEIFDHVRAGRPAAALSNLTNFVEDAYFSQRTPLENILDHVDELLAMAKSEHTQSQVPPENDPQAGPNAGPNAGSPPG